MLQHLFQHLYIFVDSNRHRLDPLPATLNACINNAFCAKPLKTPPRKILRLQQVYYPRKYVEHQYASFAFKSILLPTSVTKFPPLKLNIFLRFKNYISTTVRTSPFSIAVMVTAPVFNNIYVNTTSLTLPPPTISICWSDKVSKNPAGHSSKTYITLS